MFAAPAYSLLRSMGAHTLYRQMHPPIGVIFMCHSIGHTNESEFNPNGKWRIPTRQLELAISCAENMGFEAMSLDTVAERLQSKPTAQPFYSLTFDDGYVDNLQTALPICQRNRTPMTVYITSGFIQRKHIAWWHMIESLIADNPTLSVELSGEMIHYACDTPPRKQAAFDRISEHLTLASATDQAVFINQARERYGDSAVDYAKSLFMTETQLEEYAGKDYAFVGVHGATHCAFSRLETLQLEQELKESSDYLTVITGEIPRHLAYPYGSPSTITERDFDLAKRSGLDTAVTTRHGCLARKKGNLLALPRIPLFPTDTESSIMCKLSGLTTLFASLRNKASIRV